MYNLELRTRKAQLDIRGVSLLTPAFRRNGEGYVLTPVCLSVHKRDGWGYSHLWTGGTPISGQRGYSHLWTGGQGVPHVWGGVPQPGQDGGTPPVRTGWVPPIRTGLGVTPHLDRMRITPATWTGWGNPPPPPSDWMGVHHHPHQDWMG